MSARKNVGRAAKPKRERIYRMGSTRKLRTRELHVILRVATHSLMEPRLVPKQFLQRFAADSASKFQGLERLECQGVAIRNCPQATR